MKSLLLLLSFCSLLLSTLSAQSATSPWTEIEEAALTTVANRPERTVSPNAYKTLSLDAATLQRILASAPKEEDHSDQVSEVFEILMSNGKIEAFHLTEYSMMEPGLAAQFPTFKTYHGYGVNDPSHKIRLDWTVNGLHAMLQLPEGLAFLKPYARGDVQHYLSYFERDMPAESEPFECGTIDENLLEPKQGDNDARAGDCQLRTYRLGIAATGEYTTLSLRTSDNGTAADDALVAAHMVSNVNQMNGWYERDLTVRFILIADLTDIFYYDADNDPYTNSSSTTMLNENIANFNATIGSANFDIGHVIGNSGGSGGVAGVGVLCGASRARGVTRASATGINQPRFLKVLSHELGHQFGAGHTQNEDCQRSSASAMEPGAGTTLMSYVTSACANQIQSVPDYYFHSISISQMSARMLSTSCATILTSENNAPSVSAGIDRFVPKSTPLRLQAIATDPDNDMLTYTWEQYNNDIAEVIPPAPTNTQGPSFRSLPPTTDNVRFLPNFTAVLDGLTPIWEVLPSVERTMLFRVTVRDNSTNSISCTDEDNMVIRTTDSGPFVVNTANAAGISWFEGEPETVRWDVAGTDEAPISCASVDILLSYDGGLTFPETLASAVPNTGSATINVPNGTTTEARLLIRSSDNIFYNISDFEFEIQESTSPIFLLNLPTASTTLCEGEQASILIETRSIQGFSDDITLSVSNLPPGASAVFSTPTIPAGSAAMLEFSGSAALAPGAYSLLLTGTSGSLVQSQNFTLNVATPVGLSTLGLPTNTRISIPLLPTLTWLQKQNAVSYTLQVSADPHFKSLVENRTVLTNSYTLSNSLQESTNYYWRVKTNTVCGDTPWTPSNLFLTNYCPGPVTQDTPVDISAGNPSAITSVITMDRKGSVQHLSVTGIEGTHTYMSDLTFELSGPGGSPTVVLWSGLCAADEDFNINIDDNALTPVMDAPCAPMGQGGTFQPVEALSAFRGLPISGDWTLKVTDGAAQDGGRLNKWSLNFCLPSIPPSPFETLGLDADVNGSIILLTWEPNGDQSNAVFEVERRAENESDFTVQGVVDADQQLERYAFRDVHAVPGVHYEYRLRQNNREGNSAHSNIRTAAIESSTNTIRVYPNPVSSELSGLLDVEASTRLELLLLDVNGRVVLAKAATGPAFTMDVSNLPSGIYVLKAKHERGEEIVKVVVE